MSYNEKYKFMAKNESIMKTEEKKFCPYCGSDKILKSPGPMDTIDNGPALSIVDSVKSIIRKRYKCEDCGKEFN